MATVPSDVMARQRNLVLASLLTLAAGAWVLLAWQFLTSDEEMGLTMGMAAPLFIGIWAAMMAAMMFPTAAPMIRVFAIVQGGKTGQHLSRAELLDQGQRYLARKTHHALEQPGRRVAAMEWEMGDSGAGGHDTVR